MRRLVTVSDRVEIAIGLKAGWSLRRIAAHVGRDVSVVSREVSRIRFRGHVTDPCQHAEAGGLARLHREHGQRGLKLVDTLVGHADFRRSGSRCTRSWLWQVAARRG